MKPRRTLPPPGGWPREAPTETAILIAIDRNGSIADAARDLGMSHQRLYVLMRRYGIQRLRWTFAEVAPRNDPGVTLGVDNDHGMP